MNYNNTTPTPEQAAQIKESLKAQIDKVPNHLLDKDRPYNLGSMINVYNHFCDMKMMSIPTLIVALNEAIVEFTKLDEERKDMEFTPKFINDTVYNIAQVSNFLAMATAY